MGGLFSKSSKVSPEPVKPSTAPSRLEGNIEGPNNGLVVATRRAITPMQDSTGTAPRAPSDSEGTPKRKKVDVIGKQTDGSKLAAALPIAIQIPDDAKPWTQVFDERVVRALSSGNWKDRQEGLQAVGRNLSSSKFLSGKDEGQVYLTALQVAEKSLKDKVSPIYLATLQLLLDILNAFANKLPQSKLQEGMRPLMPMLVHRCGNLNARIHEASVQAIIAVANYPCFGCAYVGPFALAPLPKTTGKDSQRNGHMFGRLELLSTLVAALITSVEEIGLQEAMDFAKLGLEHPDEKARQAAIKVVVELYRRHLAAGRELQIENFLGSVKPVLLQTLQRKCTEAAAEEPGAAAVATGLQINSPKSKLVPLSQMGSGRQSLPPLSPTRSGRQTAPVTPSRLGQASGRMDDLSIQGRSMSLKKTGGLAAAPPSPMRESSQTKFSSKSLRRTASKRANLAHEDSQGSFTIRSFKTYDAPSSPVSVLDDDDEALIQYISADKDTAPGMSEAYTRLA